MKVEMKTEKARRLEAESRVVIGRDRYGKYCAIVLNAETDEGEWPLVVHSGLSTIGAAEIGRAEAIDQLLHDDGFHARPRQQLEAEARVLDLLRENFADSKRFLAKRIVEVAIDELDDEIPF